MKSFEVASGSPSEFVARVRDELSEHGLSRYVEVRGDETGLVVTFRWMGSTELRYRVEPGDDGFRAVLNGQSVSPFHAPFRQKFDEQFDRVLEKVGARTV